MSRTKLALAALASAFIAGAAPALADQGDTVRSVEIDVSGYDLATEQGAALVVLKIRRAAEQACDYRTGPRPLSERRAVSACIGEAMDGAIADLSTTRERRAALEAARRG